MQRSSYPTDLTDAQWKKVEPAPSPGRRRCVGVGVQPFPRSGDPLMRIQQTRLTILVIFGVVSAGACSYSAPPGPVSAPLRTSVPRDFAFVYQYGSCIDFRFDSQTGTFSRHQRYAQPAEPPVQVGVQLSNAEREAIYQEMLGIDFFSLPEEIRINLEGADQIGTVHPQRRHQLDVRRNGAWTRVRWTDQIRYPKAEQMELLRTLGDVISRLVESKEPVRQMPPPAGACL